jgi:hypothetical protein
MNEAKIKACPFCGCEDTGMAHHGPHVIVKCRNCFGSGPELEPDKQIGSVAEIDAAAIALWNKRAGDREPEAPKPPSGEVVGSKDVLDLAESWSGKANAIINLANAKSGRYAPLSDREHQKYLTLIECASELRDMVARSNVKLCEGSGQ